MNRASAPHFCSLLLSQAPSAEIPPDDRIYDFLIGSWTMEVRDRLDDGTIRTDSGECHAAWVLEGRAVQDLWICPPASARSAPPPRLGNRYGTTLRVYDLRRRTWNVTWTNPVSGAQNQLVGRRDGAVIVQEGRDAQGHPIRWCFRDLTAESMLWTGEISLDDGQHWQLQTEFRMRRQAR